MTGKGKTGAATGDGRRQRDTYRSNSLSEHSCNAHENAGNLWTAMPHVSVVRTFYLRRVFLICSAFILLVVTITTVLFFAHRSEAVTAAQGPFTESNGDKIEICADAACSTQTSTFNPGDTVYVRVTTDRVDWVNGSSNRLELRLYDNNIITTGGWNQVSYSPPYIYTAQVTIPGGQSDYMKIWGRVRSGNNGPQVQFEQQISLDGINQSMRFYSDAARTDGSYTFSSGATVYVRAWGSGSAYSAPATGNGQQRLRSFSFASMASWPAPSVAQNGNWYDFQLTLPSSGLTDGDWLWLATRLRSSSGSEIERESRMLQIDDSAPVAAITSPLDGSQVSGSLPVQGTADDTYSFYNYVLEYGAGAAPSSWNQIGVTGNAPVSGGLLETWDTTMVTDGTYTIRLTVTDMAYNTAVDTVQVYVDNTPPVISGVNASAITSNSADIYWTTDKPADSQVEYGTSPGVYTWATTLDPTLTTSHSQSLSSLEQATNYFYRVRSTDQGGHTSYSSEYSFRTANLTVLQLSPGLGMDTYFRSNRPTWNLGADVNLGAGDISGADWGTIRSTLRFDLSGIPSSATVSSANLSLHPWWQGDASPRTVDVHYLTGGWTEGSGTGSPTGDGATWSTYDGVNSWALPGGDYNATASANAVVPDIGSTPVTWVDWDLTSLAQSWIDGTVVNNGMLLKQDVENPAVTDAKAFYSGDNTNDPDLRPILTIEWFGDDVTGPAIAGVRAENISSTTADIKWSTDEMSTTKIDYGTTTSYGSTTPLDSALVNQHAVPLTGLTADTIYHYRVRSTDAAGNETVSGDYTFQTAVVLVIQPGPAEAQDTTLGSDQPLWNYGAWNYLAAGDINFAGYGTMRSVLKFDLSAIPAGATINSATMSLRQWWQGIASPVTLDLHDVTSDWTEGTGVFAPAGDGATWNLRDGVNSWSTTGGDYNPVPAASAVAPDSSSGEVWVDWDIKNLAQSWVDGAVQNNGVIIKQDIENPSFTDAKGFYASDYMGDDSLRPKLVIEYLPEPGTITMTIDQTYNRDGSSGSGSVGFGPVDAGSSYYVGDASGPTYAVKLSVRSNADWGLKVSAAGDFEQAAPPNVIGIANLAWKQDAEGPGAYQSFAAYPTETTITSGETATNGLSFYFDYRLAVPLMAVSGNYTTTITYTAYPE